MLAALVLASTPLAMFAYYSRSYSAPKVRLCVPSAITSALPIVASRLGYFADEDLDVEVEQQPYAKSCMEGLIARQYDFAVSEVSPAVDAIMMANPLVVITELYNSTHQASFVFHSGKDNFGDGFSGKKVAVVASSDGEALLRVYVKEHADIKLSSLKIVKAHDGKQAADFLEHGDVDAAVLPEPERTHFIHSYPEGEYLSEESAFYTSFGLLLSNGFFASAQPEVIDRFVRALAQAQKYVEKHPDRARMTTLAALELEDTDALHTYWTQLHFNLGLSSLLLSMMAESQSAFASNKDIAPAETSNLNISPSLYPQTLRKLDFDLVTYE